MADTHARMKGAMLAEYLRWYTTHCEPTVVRRFVRSDPLCIDLGLDAERPAFGVVPSEWYPAVVFHRLLDVALDPMSERERAQFIERSTAAVSSQMMRGLYAVLFALVATPERYSRHIQRAWNQLHDTGAREVTLSSGQAESIIRDWPGHHPALCSMVHATTQALFKHMLDRDVRITRLSCVSDGAAQCCARLNW